MNMPTLMMINLVMIKVPSTVAIHYYFSISMFDAEMKFGRMVSVDDPKSPRKRMASYKKDDEDSESLLSDTSALSLDSESEEGQKPSEVVNYRLCLPTMTNISLFSLKVQVLPLQQRRKPMAAFPRGHTSGSSEQEETTLYCSLCFSSSSSER